MSSGRIASSTKVVKPPEDDPPTKRVTRSRLKNSKILKTFLFDSSDSDVSLLKPTAKKCAKSANMCTKTLQNIEVAAVPTRAAPNRRLFSTQPAENSISKDEAPLTPELNEKQCIGSVERCSRSSPPAATTRRRSSRLKRLLGSPKSTEDQNSSVFVVEDNKPRDVIVCDTPREDYGLTVRQRQIKYSSKLINV